MPPEAISYGVVGLLISPRCFATMRGLRKLRPWVKIPGTILGVLGLANFPAGTLINGYLLHCHKGAVVLSEDYQAVIAATPGLSYKFTLRGRESSSTAKFILAVLVLLFIIAMTWALTTAEW